MQLMTIRQIRHAVPQGPLEARVHVQLETVASKFTREQKPYCELTLADAADRMTLRVWSDSPNYKACDSMQAAISSRSSANFTSINNTASMPANGNRAHSPSRNKRIFCKARPSSRAKQAADWEFIVATTAAIRDPRLYALCAEFIADYGTRFRNTAGARTYHHARRGGLVEHTAQMMRVADPNRTALSGSQSRSARRRNSLPRFRQALGKLFARDRFQHAVR